MSAAITKARSDQDGQAERVELRCALATDNLKANVFTILNDKTGAGTIDWILLTAAIVGLGMVVFCIHPAGHPAGDHDPGVRHRFGHQQGLLKEKGRRDALIGFIL